jgi:hypothetical protein
MLEEWQTENRSVTIVTLLQFVIIGYCSSGLLFAQGPAFARMKINDRVSITFSSKHLCFARLQAVSPTSIQLKVTEGGTYCGSQGQQLTLPISQIESIVNYKAEGSARRMKGMWLAVGSGAVIVTGVAIGLGSENGKASTAVVAGGLAALTAVAFAGRVRWRVQLRSLDSVR